MFNTHSLIICYQISIGLASWHEFRSQIVSGLSKEQIAQTGYKKNGASFLGIMLYAMVTLTEFYSDV